MAMTPVAKPGEGLNAAVAAELRAEQGRVRRSAPALAADAKIPYGSLRRYLAAERHIDVATLDALATALGTTSAAIVAAAEQRMSDPASSLALAADDSPGRDEEAEADDTP